MWRVRIFRTSESVLPGLSDSRNWTSCGSESRRRVPTRRTFVYSGSLLWWFKVKDNWFELHWTFPSNLPCNCHSCFHDTQTIHARNDTGRCTRFHCKNSHYKFAYSIGTLHKDTSLRCILKWQLWNIDSKCIKFISIRTVSFDLVFVRIYRTKAQIIVLNPHSRIVGFSVVFAHNVSNWWRLWLRWSENTALSWCFCNENVCWLARRFNFNLKLLSHFSFEWWKLLQLIPVKWTAIVGWEWWFYDLPIAKCLRVVALRCDRHYILL